MPLEWLPANSIRLYGNTLTKGRSGILWDKVVEKKQRKNGIVMFLAGGPVDWRSMKQTVVALSSAEAEYVAMSKASTLILHYRHLLDTINETQAEATGLRG